MYVWVRNFKLVIYYIVSALSYIYDYILSVHNATDICDASTDSCNISIDSDSFLVHFFDRIILVFLFLNRITEVSWLHLHREVSKKMVPLKNT